MPELLNYEIITIHELQSWIVSTSYLVMWLELSFSFIKFHYIVIIEGIYTCNENVIISFDIDSPDGS